MSLSDRKRAAKAVVAAIRAETFCLRCGRQPVEFHRYEHTKKPHKRIARMVQAGYPIESILGEIAQCEALCRRCHLIEDGRLLRLHEAQVAANPSRRFRGTRRVEQTLCRGCGALRRYKRWGLEGARGFCMRCYRSRWELGEFKEVA